MSEKVAIYIDGSNLCHTLKQTAGKSTVDFIKLASKLRGDRSLARIYYFNAPFNAEENTTAYKKQQSFFAALDRLQYFQVELGRLEPRRSKCPHCNTETNTYVEKGVDVNLAVMMLSQAHKNLYDTAILISGDGDFVPCHRGGQGYGKARGGRISAGDSLIDQSLRQVRAAE
jgi:uncharacterized LabA/DUF88 family protein